MGDNQKRSGVETPTAADHVKRLVSRRVDRWLQHPVSDLVGSRVWEQQRRRVSKSGFFDAGHIFIVGCGHSGTSVLLAKVDNHSRVSAIPGETRFFQRDALRRTYLLTQWARRWRPGLVLAEKTPVHVRYCDRIRATFPNAIIIGISRHPLDVIASLYLRHNNDLNKAMRRWLYDNDVLLREAAAGKIDHIIRYEDFVVDPEKALGDLQAVCGLPIEEGLSGVIDEKVAWYTERQRASDDGVESHRQKRQRQINQPVFDGRGKFKSVFEPGQIEMIWKSTKDLAEKLGYGPTPLDAD